MLRYIKVVTHPVSMLCIGAILASCFGFLFDQDFGESAEEHIVGIFTVCATISAAILALQGPLAQIKQTKELELERKRSRNLASRAFLPIALSELNKMCSFGLRLSRATDDEVFASEQYNKLEFQKRYSLSSRSEQILRDSLEYAPPRAGIVLKMILLQYQICHSRLEGMFDAHEVAFAIRRPTFTYDHIQLFGYINQLYEFARSDTEDLPEYLNPILFKIPFGLDLGDPAEQSCLASMIDLRLETIENTRIEMLLNQVL